MDETRWYDRDAAVVAQRYKMLHPQDHLGWAQDLLSSGDRLVLDVGAGSGRDSAWLAAQGADVVALEPSAAMRAEAVRLHPSDRIRWLDDALPALTQTPRLGLSFDLILLSAVWQHVAPGDRERAFRKLVGLLKPCDLLLLTLRLGPADVERAMHPVSAEEVEDLARRHGLAVERQHSMTDPLGRPEIRWIGMALGLPDDGLVTDPAPPDATRKHALTLARQAVQLEGQLVVVRVLSHRLGFSICPVAASLDDVGVTVESEIVHTWINGRPRANEARNPSSRYRPIQVARHGDS